MSKYILTQRVDRTREPIRYEIEPEGGIKWATLKRGTSSVLIGELAKETKRGWTIRSTRLTVKEIDIFLPRENFDKKYIEE